MPDMSIPIFKHRQVDPGRNRSTGEIPGIVLADDGELNFKSGDECIMMDAAADDEELTDL